MISLKESLFYNKITKIFRIFFNKKIFVMFFKNKIIMNI